MAQNATVKALNGQALVVTSGGEIRRLAVGDAINAGDTVRPAPGARLELLTDDGQTLALQGGEALLMGAEAPVPAEPAASAAVNLVLEALERGEDLDDIEAAAAGLTGGGDSDGGGFVRLLRITESTPGLDYAYDTGLRNILVDIEPNAAGEAAVETPAPGGPPAPPPPPPPPPPDYTLPDAQDDEGLVLVRVTPGEGAFNGRWQVMGAGEGSTSFEDRLAQERHEGVWLVSDKSFKEGVEGSLKGAFTITDKGSGSDPAFVVTPNFQAHAGDTFRFNAVTGLQPEDSFKAEVLLKTEPGWVVVDSIGATAGEYAHTFDTDGEYRIKFTVDDNTGGQSQAWATIDVDSDHYFTAPGETSFEYHTVTGNILGNDVLGDGSLDDHSWTFEDGEVQPDGSVLVEGDHGVLHVFDDGEYIYTPYGESQGPETFSYTLTDADGDSDTASLSIDYSTESVLDGYTLGEGGLEGDAVDLSDLIDVPDPSAEALSSYLSFDANEDGHTVMSVAPGGDMDAPDGPSLTHSMTFLDIDFEDFQSVYGESDLSIIQKLLDNDDLELA